MRTYLLLIQKHLEVTMIFSALILTACGPKKPQEPEAPKEGWIQEEGSSIACYYPPKFDALEEMPRREARSNALDALIEQWKVILFHFQ